MTQSALADSKTRVVSGLGAVRGDGSIAARPAAVRLQPRTYDQARQCVQCGLCLTACPTYVQLGVEADSPRGRIRLIKGLADGRVQPSEAVVKHLALCLDCRACEPACPSGVIYHTLIEETRGELARAGLLTADKGLTGLLCRQVFPYPLRLKLAVLPARLLQRLGLWSTVAGLPVDRWLGPGFGAMCRLLPSGGPVWERSLRARYPAHAPDGIRRGRVGVLAGCVGSVFFQRVNRQMIALLRHAGCEVIVPTDQGCCGAVHQHSGHPNHARALARTNIDAFRDKHSRWRVDWVTCGVAGCGAMLKEYSRLLRDDPVYAQAAADLASRSLDISELLVSLGLGRPPYPVRMTAAHHDACHLLHAQGVRKAPRKLLSRVKGLHLVPLDESQMCCGAAGTYNLTEPDMAGRLAQRKVDNIRRSGAKVCLTGNAGCAMQVRAEAARQGLPLEVTHPVTVLYRAYFGDRAV